MIKVVTVVTFVHLAPLGISSLAYVLMYYLHELTTISNHHSIGNGS